LIDRLRSIDKQRVRSVFGEHPASEIAAINEGLAAYLGLSDRISETGISQPQ
jgi:hypothetical protein